MSLLLVDDIHKIFHKTHAVRGVSFEIRPNEIFGLVGPNGAGKTTTLRMIAALLRPSSGTIRFDGKDTAIDPDGFRPYISYLPEDAGVYKNLTGHQYLAFIARFFEDREPAAAIAARGAEMTGLGERLSSRVSTYSKGMTRKLVIARALMVRPQLAILDEPTSGLDVISAITVRERIRDAANHGSVLLSSHNLLEVENLCHRIAFLFAGTIIECGTPEELRAKYDRKTIEEVFLHLVREKRTQEER
ncbi:ABC transporter ATP-binding protein [Myxococcota bacterium]|nr:ABC transporter ATP-binding protein [Myxococcota bacterium]MBU1411782.1 ABC transporter ATP-binding protein [Myxococcota bacterium]MBU1508989.1 ABC transporter ATP-binding protein [Myxococcota bacterium]